MVTVMCLLQDSKKQCALKAGRDLLSPALTHLPSSPRTRIPLFPLLSLEESCSCDHRAVPHSQPALGAATREAKSLHPSTMPGDISFLGALGNLTPDLHTRGLFQNMPRVSLGLEWDVSITALSMSHSCTPFCALWPPVPATGEAKLTRNQQLST